MTSDQHLLPENITVEKQSERSMKQPSTINPPIASTRQQRLEKHGDVRYDDYFWLRYREDSAVIDYLEAENDYTEACLTPTVELQEQLYQEMRGRMAESDSSAPQQIGDYVYYWRIEEGEQYSIHCRRRILDEHGNRVVDPQEEVLLDENLLAAPHDYFRLGDFTVSPDHTLLAYTMDTTGGESYTLAIKDLKTGELLPDQVSGLYYGLVWANDNRTIFYTTHDTAHRPDKLLCHHLGESVEEDKVVLHEPDEAYFLEPAKSKDHAYILIHLGSKLTDEVWFLDANQPTLDPQVVQPRILGLEYSVTYHEGRFLIVTNWEAENFRLMETAVDTPQQANWQEVIAHRPHVKIDRVEAFQEYLVLYEREGGLKQIAITHFATGEAHTIAMPEPVYALYGVENPNYESQVMRFNYASLTTPKTVMEYDMSSQTSTVLKQDEVVGGYDSAAYQSERLWATAEDGAQVPISLVYRKAPIQRPEPVEGQPSVEPVETDESRQPRPTLLTGYGSYGVSKEPLFSSHLISLLDRGFVFAIAHIRGGGEMGRAWYERGKFFHKKNTFTDFIACAEHLIEQGYTKPEKLAVSGRSAGGLLMGAIANMRPELFGAMVAGVPFVDVISTMLDPSIPLTVTEYEEWGDPNDEEYYAYMKSYSPYDNLDSKAYPPMLVTAGLNDPRVQYWEPAKWVAKLRALKTDENVLLLKTNMAAGHGGPTGRYAYIKDELAVEYAFVLGCVG